MRFVVFLDLLSTIVQPVIVGYIAYLIVLVASRDNVVPLTAFILLGAIYGLQAIIFILRRKWEMIGWMIIYMLATPIFSLCIPLYSFWRQDDFSWGNTRIVTGEKGQKVVVSDEGKFDPSSIPKKRWEEYQAELWDQHTQMGDDTRSEMSGVSYGTKSFVYGSHPGAMAGAMPGGPLGVHDVYGVGAGVPSRPLSHLDVRYSSSRLSLAQQAGGHMGEVEMAELNGGNPQPTDDMLLAEIREVLKSANLMTVTKKQIRAELEQRFGVSLESRKAYINSATEAVLSGQL
jgi:chitin synthase